LIRIQPGGKIFDQRIGLSGGGDQGTISFHFVNGHECNQLSLMCRPNVLGAERIPLHDVADSKCSMTDIRATDWLSIARHPRSA